MWTLVVMSLTAPFMQAEFKTSEDCVKAYPPPQAGSLGPVKQAYCSSASAPVVWIVKDGEKVK